MMMFWARMVEAEMVRGCQIWGYILKVDLNEFADGLDLDEGRKKRIKDISHFLA